MECHTYETHVFEDLKSGSVVCRVCQRVELSRDVFVIRWGNGCPGSNGTAGAPGRLTHVMETLDPLQIDAFTTPEDGLNTYQGRITAISLPSSGDEGDEYTLTVSFDHQTSLRLRGRAFGHPGSRDTEGAGYSLTIVRGEPPTT